MKLLFLLDNLYTFESSNVAIARTVARQLAAHGHQVSLLVNTLPENQYAMQGFRAHFFCYDAEKKLYDHVKTARQKGKGALYQALSLLAKPRQLWAAIRLYLFKTSVVEKAYRARLEALCQREAFDAVVAVACPYYTAFALAAADIAAKKAGYLLDPYATNETTLRHTASRRRERWLYQKLDALLVTPPMAEESRTGPLAAYSEKITPLPFPGIVPLAAGGHSPAGGPIQCAYVGNLYPGIRSPEYVLQVFSRIKAPLHLSFTGGGYEGFSPNFFDPYRQAMGQRLALNPPVDAETAGQLLAGVDVLINIGNTAKNQLPSKVLQLISTGRPVLNFYKIEGCPSLPLFRQYPLALNVREGDFSPATLEAIETFCLAARGRRLDYAEIETRFAAYTPAAVGDVFSAALQKLMP